MRTKIMKQKLKNSSSKTKSYFSNASISFKIMIYYLVFLIISVVLSTILYQKVLSNIITSKVSDMSMQMLNSISANFNSMIDTAGEYSKIISFNEEIQDSLRKSSKVNDFNNELKSNTSITRLISGNALISSVYIFDSYGNRYSASKDQVKVLGIKELSEAQWFPKMKEKKGEYILRLNAGGIFLPTNSKENFISLIRTINDLDSQKPIGTIIVNISESEIKKTYDSIVSNNNTKVVLLDDENRIVVSTADTMGFDITKFSKESSMKDSNWVKWKFENVEYIVSYLRIKENGWKIISMLPVRESSKETKIFSFIAFGILALNSFMLFIGSIIISRLISMPIKKLLQSMKGIENGEFRKVDIKTGNDEIGKLRDGYNKMISEIQNLISRIMEEQKLKRKIELDVLQAQIKPHFLYNTFDAISYLALSGKNKDVYNIMKALGTYYKLSLSKGNEVISIGEEIEIVVNYLKIQKYRYEDMFSVEYDIDEEVKKYRILKLVLQPLAENALYHGIRPKGLSGKIWISAKCCDGSIILQVADDGVGMSAEEVDKLATGKILSQNQSFGVWGTIERLRIFYGVDNIVSIESQVNRGTKISIIIPMKGASNDVNKPVKSNDC